MKRQAIDWEKILAKHVSNKRLVCWTYKVNAKLNSKTCKKINWKMRKRHEQVFP